MCTPWFVLYTRPDIDIYDYDWPVLDIFIDSYMWLFIPFTHALWLTFSAMAQYMPLFDPDPGTPA